MGLKMTNKKEVHAYLSNYLKRAEASLIYSLEYLVAELQNHAKSSAQYVDRTSNLKSSIGGIVLKDGQPVAYRGFEKTGQGSEGTTTGLEFINSLISQNNRGYVIILVAGMNYATYVENYYGLNVLKKSELRMQRELPKLLDKLKQKMK